MKKKEHLSMGWLSILLGAMLFIWACSQTIEPDISQESKPRESSMEIDIETSLPPIDTAAPSIFETASFGLG